MLKFDAHVSEICKKRASKQLIVLKRLGGFFNKAKENVGIPVGTNYAPLHADFIFICYEGDFMLSLSDNNQADIVEAFNSTSRYLDDLLNIDNPFLHKW